MIAMLLALAAVSTGLVAGLYAGFAYAVMPGLRRVDDAAFVATMRGINAAILNPVFLVLFVGALVVSVAAAVAADPGEVRWWAVVGAVLYLLTVVTTAAVNVPLNTALDDSDAPAAATRTAFEARWVAWNVVRSVAGVGSCLALLVALAKV